MAELVEILARELEEWPEGADSAWQSEFDSEIYFDGCEWNCSFFATEAADDRGYPYNGVGVTREMWEAERAKVKGKTEWNGEGLPPVGAKCEARAVTNISEFKWIEVKIEFISEKGVFLTSDELTGGCIGLPVKHVEFRPIRTPEQVAAQEREDAIKAMASSLYDHAIENRLPMSEVGAASLAIMMYEGGYRKQEISK